MSNLYNEFWVSKMEKEDIILFSMKEVEDYVKLFTRGTQVLIEHHILDCCDEGHTFREIMGYDDWKHNKLTSH